MLNKKLFELRSKNSIFSFILQLVTATFLSCIETFYILGEFACDQCGKVLKSKGSLDYHKRTHTGEFAYR